MISAATPNRDTFNLAVISAILSGGILETPFHQARN